MQNEQGEVSFLYRNDDSIFKKILWQIEGCLNEGCNFNPEANEDDGTYIEVNVVVKESFLGNATVTVLRCFECMNDYDLTLMESVIMKKSWLYIFRSKQLQR